jgi:16S rRNA processing protein RimM
VDSISEAERFRGQEIKLPEEDIPDREEDQYYLYQLTGCRVFDSKGEKIGVVREIQIIAGNELLVLETGHADILIPFAAEICREIDLKQRKIIIDPPEGLLDLNEI